MYDKAVYDGGITRLDIGANIQLAHPGVVQSTRTLERHLQLRKSLYHSVQTRIYVLYPAPHA